MTIEEKVEAALAVANQYLAEQSFKQLDGPVARALLLGVLTVIGSDLQSLEDHLVNQIDPFPAAGDV